MKCAPNGLQFEYAIYLGHTSLETLKYDKLYSPPIFLCPGLDSNHPIPKEIDGHNQMQAG